MKAGHVRRRSENSFEIRYSLGPDPGTGKRRVRTETVRGNRRDAERALRDRLQKLDLGGYVDPSRVLVGQYLDSWLAAAKQETSPRTHERRAELVAGFLRPALGAIPLAKLAPLHIQQMLNDLASGGRRDGKPGGLSPQTRRHIHRTLSTALNRAVELQMLTSNPAVALRRRLPKVERRDLVVLSTDDATRLLAAFRHIRLYWPVFIALATGCRRGEILALRWRHVDLDRGVVTVAQTLEETGTGLRFKPPKSGQGRSVPLPEFAVGELHRHKREQAEELLALGIRQDGDTLVCRRANPFNPDGTVDPEAALAGRMLGHEYRRAFRALKPGVRYLPLHNLRHSHASQLLTMGVHPKVVQERLGHPSIGITMNIYSHVAASLQDDAVGRLDRAFRASGSNSSSNR